MRETWKDIKGYEGLYQISNLGQVKSLERKVKNKNGYRKIKEKILTNFISKNGYYTVSLRKNCNIDIKTIHRLVATAFIPNPNEYPCINHINGNKLNNCIENLEWCTCSHNVKEAFKLGLNKHIDFKKKKTVIQYDLKEKPIKEWKSIYSAGKTTKIKTSSIIRACQDKQKTAGGFIWKYKEAI